MFDLGLRMVGYDWFPDEKPKAVAKWAAAGMLEPGQLHLDWTRRAHYEIWAPMEHERKMGSSTWNGTLSLSLNSSREEWFWFEERVRDGM